MIQKAILLCLALVASVGTLSAQKCDLVLRGRVLHLENNQPIEAAYVWLSEFLLRMRMVESLKNLELIIF